MSMFLSPEDSYITLPWGRIQDKYVHNVRKSDNVSNLILLHCASRGVFLDYLLNGRETDSVCFFLFYAAVTYHNQGTCVCICLVLSP